jgi:ribosome recycling factor|tara:strand:- start:23193 stop:23747 length:555 start_codon:yes stop_codon:yes gene_type:complete
MEEINFIIDSAKEQMSSNIDHLEHAFSKIRAGKASPSMLDNVSIDYYGSVTPLGQSSNVNTPDARTITVQPWDKTMLEVMDKAILDSNLGFTPMNNGEMLIINIPPLTEERRRDLAKKAKSESENAKISIRNARKEANDELKKIDSVSEDLIKDAEEQIQKLTNEFTSKVDATYSVKEVEIMTV